MNKENCALKLVDEIILYYDARSKKHQTAKCVIRLLHDAVLFYEVIQDETRKSGGRGGGGKRSKIKRN